jgi:hypothetical protein
MYLLLLLSILFASLNSLVLHKSGTFGASDVFSYNFISAGVWCVILFAANGFRLDISRDVILWGVVYVLTQAAFILFKTLAMNSGPVSITTLIGNFSLIISIFVCFVCWQEAVGAFDILGLVLLLF